MKTTLEEYFKNAEKVKGVDGTTATFSKSDFRGIHKWGGDYWICAEYGNCLIYESDTKKYAEIISYKDEPIGNTEQLQTPNHYDNSKGTLYKVATERNWNPYLFDIVKRLERAEKKGEFKTDLEKSINVIKLWLNESE